MAGAEENLEKFNLSLTMNGHPSIDLLKRIRNHQTQFSNGNNDEEGEEEEELELSLGLSMNGVFGVDPTCKKLRRSSTISNSAFTLGSAAAVDCRDAREAAFEGYAPLLFRTCSLPVVQGDGSKELMSMKQMEARKKRMEKLKNVRLVKDLKENSSADFSNNENESADAAEVLDGFENGNGNMLLLPSSQGSIGSQGSGSSGFSDLHSQQLEGTKQTTELKSPSGHQASVVEQKPPIRAAGRDAKTTNKLLDMPYVSLRGDGGNSNRTEGFLYRYKKGEEVKIVCVCHGMFLSPAEFVKHGGGGDVEHPLKHIVVGHSPLF